MLKIFTLRKPKINPESNVSRKRTPVPAGPDRSPAALRIIHPGGLTEQYYMAIPAARIIEKYPSFILTRPDVFRRPWDAVVLPDDILIPGQKYFVVPRQTVKKLRRRIKKPSPINSGLFLASDASHEGDSFTSSTLFSQHTDDVKRSTGIMIKSCIKNNTRNRHVRFFGIDKEDDSTSVSVEQEAIIPEIAEKNPNRRRSDGRKGRTRHTVHWQPSLTSITENNIGEE